jgi:DNA invertase Pin-like site-specific DNA recombinase
MRVIAYRRVSTDQQGESGAGLEAQASALDAEVERRGWDLVETYTDVASGKSMRKRDELATALERMAAGDADLLMVAKLDRLSRSLLDFAQLMALAQREGWGIVALDIGVDTSSVNGELMAHIIMALAQWERRIIGQRTKDALAIVKGRGVKLGRPTLVDDSTVQLIGILRAEGKSYRAIADVLNRQLVPTAQGGLLWYASTVKTMADRTQKNTPTTRR